MPKYRPIDIELLNVLKEKSFDVVVDDENKTSTRFLKHKDVTYQVRAIYPPYQRPYRKFFDTLEKRYPDFSTKTVSYIPQAVRVSEGHVSDIAFVKDVISISPQRYPPLETLTKALCVATAVADSGCFMKSLDKDLIVIKTSKKTIKMRFGAKSVDIETNGWSLAVGGLGPEISEEYFYKKDPQIFLRLVFDVLLEFGWPNVGSGCGAVRSLKSPLVQITRLALGTSCTSIWLPDKNCDISGMAIPQESLLLVARTASDRRLAPAMLYYLTLALPMRPGARNRDIALMLLAIADLTRKKLHVPDLTLEDFEETEGPNYIVLKTKIEAGGKRFLIKKERTKPGAKPPLMVASLLALFAPRNQRKVVPWAKADLTSRCPPACKDVAASFLFGEDNGEIATFDALFVLENSATFQGISLGALALAYRNYLVN